MSLGPQRGVTGEGRLSMSTIENPASESLTLNPSPVAQLEAHNP